MLEVEIDISDISNELKTSDERCCIEYIEKIENNIEYNTFYQKFIRKNLPCIIKNVSATWDCSRKWMSNNTINYAYLEEIYGDLEAPVANCNTLSYDSHDKVTMKVKDYLHYLRRNEREQLLYLKDWHLKLHRPQDVFYEIPKYFSSDWLNEYCIDNNKDDFMFVYIGPQNSWTPLHADVYSSFSWSVNVVGRKKWILFPPLEEKKIKDKFGNLPILFESEENKKIQYFEVTQEKGDAIFVPSGWYHQVINELDTISINHNWINASNFAAVWYALNATLISVENEINEFRDTSEFDSQCQIILKSLFGMNFLDFIAFTVYIGNKRVSQITHKSGFYNYILGKNHIKYDLSNILNVMEMIHSHALLSKKLFTPNIISGFLDTKHTISKYLEEN